MSDRRGSLIEQAANRLEELRKSGVEMPTDAVPQATPAAPAPQPAANAPQAAPVHRPFTPRVAPTAEDEARAPRVELDVKKLATKGFLTHDAPRSRLADEFRNLKRPLLANARPQGVKDGNLIMVTSSVPSEGKTFTAINLAMSMAMEMDRQVVLVDGDVARPCVPGNLEIEPRPGLLDVLGHAAMPLHQVILRTNVPRLSLLMSGKPRPHASEMLASAAMKRLLSELGSHPDRIVIFDSPPLLSTSEARELATHVGQIVFVVHAETTKQSDVKNALATIEACPVKLLVLNGATLPSQGAYGYGYGYGYGE